LKGGRQFIACHTERFGSRIQFDRTKPEGSNRPNGVPNRLNVYVFFSGKLFERLA
jgi:hypothetical protein